MSSILQTVFCQHHVFTAFHNLRSPVRTDVLQKDPVFLTDIVKRENLSDPSSHRALVNAPWSSSSTYSTSVRVRSHIADTQQIFRCGFSAELVTDLFVHTYIALNPHKVAYDGPLYIHSLWAPIKQVTLDDVI